MTKNVTSLGVRRPLPRFPSSTAKVASDPRRARVRLRPVALVLVALVGAFAFSVATPRDAFAQKGGHDEITLAVGETRSLSIAGIRDYSEGVKGIIDVVTPDARTFVITGKKEGSTTLLLISNSGAQTSYEINVAKRNVGLVEREVQELIKDISGPKTRRIGARVFIDGAVATPAEKARVDQIAALYGEQVQSIVTVGRFEERKLLVRLDFFFVQYEKTSGYNAGIGWPASIGGVQPNGTSPVFENQYTFDFITRTSTTAQASIVNQPMPRLDIAARRGWVKIAKQSSVITANGNEATFQNGGEQNFIIATGFAANLVNVRFGTNVTVLPRYDSNTRDVELKLVTDVADLTAPAVSNGPPGRTTTKLDTQVTLKLGQALILSGIKTATQRHNVGGIPGLSDIPVLGVLFGSHANEKAEVEGALFIVPSIVDTVPKSAIDLINNAMTTYKEYSGDIEYVDTYPKTPPNAK